MVGAAGEQLRTPAARQNEGPGNALLATLVYEHVSEVITGFGEKGVSAEHGSKPSRADPGGASVWWIRGLMEE